MESTDKNQLRAILDRSPRAAVRMYELLDAPHEEEVHYYMNKSAVLFTSWSVMLWAEKEDDLIPLLQFIPRNQPETEFFCIESRFMPLLEKHIAPVAVNADCHIWILDKLQEEAPTLESLRREDAPFVNDHWDYKFDGSLGFIEHCIESMPTSCIRNEKGQPVAMAFCYGQSPHHINMGGFKVLPEHRKQGLGHKIHLDMCRKVLAQNRKPLVHIRTDNPISQHICQNTGFTRHEQVFWGTIKNKQNHTDKTEVPPTII